MAASIALPAAAASPHSGLLFAAVSSRETEVQREARLIEGAKKEGKVVYWDTGSAREWEQPFKAFRQKYPFLAVEFWRASENEVHQKITTEAKAGVYNVDIAGTEINLVADLKKTGLMKKYDWPNTAAWSPNYKDRDGYWIARHILCVVVAYNTDLVSPAEAPKTWDDLLDPKWKGVISTDKDGGEWVLMLWAAWGKDKTLSYLKGLAKNNVVLGPGATARTEMLAAGANKIDARLNLNRLLEYQQKGAPIDWVRMDPVLAKVTPIFIAERAPHPHAAMLFADWFTSSEGQQSYYDASGRLLPDPRLKSKVGEAVKGQKLALFPVELTVHGSEADSIWRALFYK
jgi:iron(III) transport system substrate-binding protein